MLLSPAGKWFVLRAVIRRAFIWRACAAALIAPVFLVALPLLQPRAAVAASASGSAGEKHARELFQRAERSFNLGRFPDALTDYQAAYEAKPLPGLLFNIAQCYRNMQNYERARFFFRRYLSLDPHTSNRRLVEGLIADMTRELDRIEKNAQAERAEKAAKEAGEDQPAVLMAPAALAPAPVVTPPPAPPPPAPALALERQAPPPAEPHPIYKRWWFWSGVGAVVAGGVVAAILLARPETPQGSLGIIKTKP
jgi:tetratricopeptide (TPR) repeat protein